MRVLCAVGPGDAVSSYRDWIAGVRTPTETSITYTSQTYEFFARHEIPFWVVSSNARRERIDAGPNRIENRPRIGGGQASGTIYHIVQFLYALSLLGSGIRFQATHAIVDSGTTHWFILTLFPLFRIQVVPNFHNVYWPAGHPPHGAVRNAILSLDKIFFRRCVKSALGVSPECGRQVALLSSDRTRFFCHRAQFRTADFSAIAPPLPPARYVHILFAGRIEVSKGVFDLLRMCEILSLDPDHDFHFEVCGSGAALESLVAAAAACYLSDRFAIRGKLDRKELLAAYARAHIVVVPTRSESGEGFAMVCAEAVLAGRPFVTSKVVPALEDLRECAVEAKEDDPEDYAKELVLLASDAARFKRLVANTRECAQQFVDERHGLTSALELCLFANGNDACGRCE